MLNADKFDLSGKDPNKTVYLDRYDVLGTILERPLAEKFRELCKPNTAEQVIETFIRNAVKSGVKYDDYIKGGE
jgi:hypothetical protein